MAPAIKPKSKMQARKHVPSSSKGVGKGFGGGRNNGTGQSGTWMFVPTQTSFGGGFGGGGKAASKGKGKNKSNGKVVIKGKEKGKGDSKFMDKLAKIDASRKVWVGGLTEATTWKQLEEHFKTVAKPSVTEIMRNGKACIAFKTDEDAESAISSMNGSELEGNVIEVDVWTQKEKTAKPEREKGEKTRGNKKMKLLTKFGNKSAKSSRCDPKMREKMEKIESSLKVWVGGLAETTKAGFLRKHFSDEGCNPQFTNLSGKANGCLAFKTEDEAQSAISTMQGTTLDGQVIEVDTWERPERKEKK